MTYSLRQLMIAAAAREIRDGEHVFVGMRLPLLAFLVAKGTHAPDAIGYYENGVIRQSPAARMLYTMSDPPNILGATLCTDMLGVMAPLQRGRIDLGFIGGAEVDRLGNLNTSYVAGEGKTVRLPGSGGGSDIASLAHRLVIIMPHERRRLVERVSYITSSGYGDGSGWRQRVGLKRGGPSALITSLAVFRFDRASGEAFVASVHPGVTMEQVKEQTGWAVRFADDLRETSAPWGEELEVIRRYDPSGFWSS